VFLALDLLLSTTADYDDSDLVGDILPLLQSIVHLFLWLCVILAFFLMISATYPFRVGLWGFICKELSVLLVAMAIYFVALAAYSGVRFPMTIGKGQVNSVLRMHDESSFRVLSAIHKVAGLLYYAASLDAVLRLGEPRYYEQREWTREMRVKRALAKLNEERMNVHGGAIAP